MEFSSEEKAALKAWAFGKRHGQYRTTCPACSQTRRNSKAQCVSITVEHDHWVASCHHCERRGAGRFAEFVPPQMEKPKRTAIKRLDKDLTEASVEYLTGRGISHKTAQVFGLVSARAYFPDLEGQAEAIAFPYEKGHKLRAYPDKAHVCSEPLGSLFGLAQVDLAESEDLIISEGEMEPLSFYEAGVLNATSVPNGSSSFTKTNPDGTLREQMGFLWSAKDIIAKAKRVIIAPDNDEPGEKIAEELARRIGYHKVWRISYPDGIKDCNELLQKLGPDAVKEAYEKAEPWPIDGVYEASHYYDAVDDLFENGFGEKVKTGIAAIDELYSVAPGMLTVVTGSPNAGKSNLINQIVINLARRYGHVTAMCSFETAPAIHIGQLAEMLLQRHFFQTTEPGERMTRKQLDEVKPFIHQHIKFISMEDGGKATIESIIERIKTAVFRWGISVAVIDPYSYIHRPSSYQSETEFVSHMLTQLRMLAKSHGIHVILVAHPQKPSTNSDGSYAVPKGYSISGSAAFFNHPDHGLSVHRVPNSTIVELHVWKTRLAPALGQNGVATFYYDKTLHNYYSDQFDEPF